MLRPVYITQCIALTLVLIWAAPIRADDPFTPGCTLPFAGIAQTHPLDNSCPIQGQGSAKSQLQNQAKNNFCAAGTPVTLTYQNFKSLQTAVKNARGARTRLPQHYRGDQPAFPPGTMGTGSTARGARPPCADHGTAVLRCRP